MSRFNRHMQKILLNIEAEIRYQKLKKREFKLLTGDIALLNGFIVKNKDISKDFAQK